MKTFKRICLKNWSITDDGNTFRVDKGKEYITSDVNGAPAIGPSPVKDHVIVFGRYWVAVPVEIFGGEIEFTK